MSYIISNWIDYKRIAFSHFTIYKQLITERDKIDYNNINTTEEERKRIGDLQESAKENALIAVLFEAFAVEAFINYYGYMRLGEKDFCLVPDKYIESKFKNIIFRATGNGFPAKSKEYKMFVKLFKTRNALVHSKSTIVNGLFANQKEEIEEQAHRVLSTLWGDGKDVLFSYIDDLIGICDKIENVVIDLEKRTTAPMNTYTK